MSIAEVAKRAGVSCATVSRVINRRVGVSPEIVSAVKQAVAALGYEPPPLDRRPGRRAPIPKKGAAGMIAVVLLDDLYHHTPGVFAAHLQGIEREAAENGVAVMVCHVTPGNRLPTPIASQNVDGLILMGSRAEADVLRLLERYTSVWLSSHQDPRGHAVLAGNQTIAKIAVDYLAKRGHRNVGFLAVMSSYPAYPARCETFRFYAAQAGLNVSIFMDQAQPDEEIRIGDLGVLQERIAEQAALLAVAANRPTGLFIPNDMMTAMCFVELRSRGIIPGRDIDIISCNNEMSYLIGLDPRPATIDIGAETIGRRSVEQLLRRIKHPEESRQVQIAVTPMLIEGSIPWRSN